MYGSPTIRELRLERLAERRRKGSARKRRQAEELGERNERRFHGLVERLVEVLAELFPSHEYLLNRSGKHNPRKGRIDLADHLGEDVVLRRIFWQGRASFTRRIAYDVKSSRSRVAMHNERFLRYRYIEDTFVFCRKAIAVNPYRSDAEVVAEVLDDMVRARLLRKSVPRECLVQLFKES